MKKIVFIYFLSSLTTILFAQKKLVPVQQSTLTGISLPVGSKQDKRMLSVASAKIVLEMQTKKNNITIASPEVLVLPPVAAGGFSADSLVKNLSDQGWTISVVEEDQEYAWLQKDNRSLIVYFSIDAKETSLYFAEASSAPVQIGNDAGLVETTSMQTNQPQETTNTIIQSNQVEVVQQPVSNSGVAFTTTNFDDGWTSTVHEDWVEVTKGNIKVLIHYPKSGTIFAADPAPLAR